jgi:epoxyqueuosine reductase QueG
MTQRNIRSKVIKEARRLGAELVGFAPVSRWDDFDEVPELYRPRSVWREAETVIVLGVPILLPIIESTPSVNYQELYNTTNQLLDRAAYLLSVFLNNLGFASIFLPRDGYGNLEILRRKPVAGFGHVYAGKYAGLGTVGLHNMLITPEFGPRVRLVSVFTEAKIDGSPLQKKELCPKCGLCARLCPVDAFKESEDKIAAEMDKNRCTVRHQELRKKSCWPCGICAKVCPIGADRVLYKRRNVRYLREGKSPSGVPESNRKPAPYGEWEHLREHGSEEVNR